MSINNSCRFNGYVSTDKDNSPLEVRKIGEGDKAFSSLNFRVSVPRDQKTKDGKRLYDNINVSVAGSTADFIAKYFKPGDVICIEGELETFKRKDGEGYGWVVRVKSVGFPMGGGNSGGKPTTTKKNVDVSADSPSSSRGTSGMGDFEEIEDDDLPF